MMMMIFAFFTGLAVATVFFADLLLLAISAFEPGWRSFIRAAMILKSCLCVMSNVCRELVNSSRIASAQGTRLRQIEN
jgi:hypothetical protein